MSNGQFFLCFAGEFSPYIKLELQSEQLVFVKNSRYWRRSIRNRFRLCKSSDSTSFGRFVEVDATVLPSFEVTDGDSSKLTSCCCAFLP